MRSLVLSCWIGQRFGETIKRLFGRDLDHGIAAGAKQIVVGLNADIGTVRQIVRVAYQHRPFVGAIKRSASADYGLRRIGLDCVQPFDENPFRMMCCRYLCESGSRGDQAGNLRRASFCCRGAMPSGSLRRRKAVSSRVARAANRACAALRMAGSLCE